MRTILLLYFMTLCAQIIGQTYEFEVWYQDANSKISDAKKYHFKSITIYAHSYGTDTITRLYAKETYDSLGNILTKIEHHFSRYQDFEETTYTYDTKKRLIAITGKPSFTDGYHDKTKIRYKNNGELDYLIHGWGKEGDFRFDTLNFEFTIDGKIDFKYFSSGNDTIFYHYNNDGAYINSSYSAKDTVDNRILNANGCIVGYKDTLDYKYTMTCDTLCNTLTRKREMLIHGKWIVISQSESAYSGTKLKESKSYACPKQILNRCSGKLELKEHIKYDYNDEGFIAKETKYDSSGLIVEVKDYVYETYTK